MNPNVKIDLSHLDELVKLQCGNLDCANNMITRPSGGGFYCNLKYVGINHEGKCEQFEPINKDDGNEHY